MTGGAGGHEVERISVKVVPDTGGFAEDLKRFLNEEEAKTSLNINLTLDSKEVEAKLKEISKDLSVTVKVNLDDAGIKAKLDALGKNQDVTVNANLDDKAAAARLDLLTRTRDVKIRANVDKNPLSQLDQVLGNVTNVAKDAGTQITNVFGDVSSGADQANKGISSIGSSAGKLSAIMQVVGAVIMGVVYAALLNVFIIIGAIAGAIALALAPVAFIAAGVAFEVLGQKGTKTSQKLKAAFTDVYKTAKGVISNAVQPMTKAIDAQIPKLDKWIKSLNGPLKDAFKSSAKYVDELGRGLKNFVDNTLAGLVKALKNPQLQGLMTGLQKLFGDIGTAIGSFFSQLANSGNDFGKTFDALGKALIAIAPAFADMLGAFAKTSPDLIKTIADDIVMILNALSDPGTLKAIEFLSSFALNTLMLGLGLVIGAFSAAGNASAVFAIVTGFALAAVELLWMGLKAALAAIWNGIKSAASSIWNGIKTVITGAVLGTLSVVLGTWNRLQSGTTGAWNAIKGATSSIFGGIWGVIKRIMSGIVGTIVGALGQVTGNFSSSWNLISRIVGWIKGAVSSIWNAVSGIGSAISKLNPFGLAVEPVGGDPSAGDGPAMAPGFAVPAPQPMTAQPMALNDSLSSLDRAGSRLSNSLNSSALDVPTSATSNSGVSTLAQRVFNFTINAAPNVPTEQTIIKALSYADALYAQ